MKKYKVWTVEDVKEVLDEMKDMCGLDWRGLEIKINGRLTSAYGYFHARFDKKGKLIEPISIHIAKRLTLGDVPEEEVKKVIQHEYMHYYSDTTENINCGHGKLFKAHCSEFGLSNIASSTGDLSEYIDKENKYKYEVTCCNCNNTFGIKRLPCKKTLYTKRYICSKCKGKLKLKQLY